MYQSVCDKFVQNIYGTRNIPNEGSAGLEVSPITGTTRVRKSVCPQPALACCQAVLNFCGGTHPKGVWPPLIVIHLPTLDSLPRFSERLESALAQELVPDIAVEAFDVDILHRLPQVD